MPPSKASRPSRLLMTDDNVIGTRTAARILRAATRNVALPMGAAALSAELRRRGQA